LNLRAGQDRFDHEIITMRTMEYNNGDTPD